MDNVLFPLATFAAGLVVGWNLLPQPQWVKDIYDKVAGWFKKS